MMELATLCQQSLPVKIILSNNHRLGMIRELQDRQFGGRHTAVELNGSPDFIALAQASGIPGSRLSREEDASAAIDDMLRSPGPYLLECLVDPDLPTLE